MSGDIRNPIRIRRVVACAIVAVLASSSETAPAVAAEVRTAGNHDVDQRNQQFNPTALDVVTGDTVVWTNQETDGTVHSVVQKNGAEINSPDIAPAESFSWTFEEPGKYEIVCRYHPSMYMTVTITSETPAAAKKEAKKDAKRGANKKPKAKPKGEPVAQPFHDTHGESTAKSIPAPPPGPAESTIPGVAGLPFAVVPGEESAL